MYKGAWVVVANASTAKFYKATSNDTLEEVDAIDHPKSRARGRDIFTDKPGRSFDIGGRGRHHVGTLQEVDTQELMRFAKELSQKLVKLSEAGELKKIYLVASPKFLGVLNKNLDPKIQSLIEGKVDKDLTSEPPDAIRQHLPLTL